MTLVWVRGSSSSSSLRSKGYEQVSMVNSMTPTLQMSASLASYCRDVSTSGAASEARMSMMTGMAAAAAQQLKTR